MQNDFWYEFGFHRAGVIVSNYALWLIEQFKKNDSEQVILFARDGAIIKDLFDIYAGVKGELPKYDYVLASRRAFVIPALSDVLEQKDVLNILGLISLNYENLSERLAYLGFEPSEFKPYFKEFQDIALDGNMLRKEKEEKLVETKLFKEIIKNIKEVSSKERSLLESYLKNKNVLNSSKVALVDGFGHGTCQYCFEKMLKNIENNIEDIKGFYMATYSPNDGVKYQNISQQAYMFDFESYDFEKMPITDAYVFELIFGSTNGSFIRFGNKLTPMFDKDATSRKEIVEQIQNGVKDYFKQYLEKDGELKSGDYVLGKCSSLMRNPTYIEAVEIGNILVIDADVDRGFCIAKPQFAHLFKKGLKYLWKEAYFKRLNPFG